MCGIELVVPDTIAEVMDCLMSDVAEDQRLPSTLDVYKCFMKTIE